MVSTRSRQGRPLPAPRRPRAQPAGYKDTDHCHRHRIADRKPKTVAVTTYRRRKPIRT